jgi:pyruvate formate lyase activating enzyme
MTTGLIFDVKRFAVHDGPGIRTTVFFKGCPLGCWWCHNPESRSAGIQTSMKSIRLEDQTFSCEEITGRVMTVEDVLEEVERDNAFYQSSGGGVTLSGGEPLFQPEFCVNLLKTLKQSGLHTALDTTGFATPEVIREVIPLTDLFLFDLKLMDEAKHLQFTGEGNRLILDNLKLIAASGKRFVIRFPVIPGITDSGANIEAMIVFLQKLLDDFKPTVKCSNRLSDKESLGISVDLLPYHTIAKNKYPRFGIENRMEKIGELKQEQLDRIAAKLEQAGFEVGIGG